MNWVQRPSEHEPLASRSVAQVILHFFPTSGPPNERSFIWCLTKETAVWSCVYRKTGCVGLLSGGVIVTNEERICVPILCFAVIKKAIRGNSNFTQFAPQLCGRACGCSPVSMGSHTRLSAV